MTRSKASKRAYARAYYIKHRKKILARARDHRRLSLSKRYGITHEDYEEMLVKQHGRCAICGKKSNGSKKKYFDIDHCHETGKVRGLLCNWCNRRLISLDDKEWFKKAQKYVSQTQ